MTRSTPLLTITLCALVLTACDTGGRDSVTGPAKPDLQASSSDAPPAQARAAVIEIDQTPTYFFHLDTERNPLSVHLPSDYAGCGGGSGLNVADRRIITTSSEIEQRLVQLKDRDSRVAVYRASSLAVLNDFCNFLRGPARIAEGTVNQIQNLSNASFEARWGGTIEAVDGGSLHLSEIYQLRGDAHDPSNPAAYVLDASQVLLSPTR